MGDHLAVHFPGKNFDSYWLAKGLQTAFLPVVLAGLGDPRLAPQCCHLKEIIKECEVLVEGTIYTHESLIGSVAAQMGSAHEDDGVDPHLVDLTRTILANQPLLIHLLCSDAQLVLELGETTLETLPRETGFVRKKRAPIPAPTPPADVCLAAPFDDFEVPPPITPLLGTVTFEVTHPDLDWMENANCYDFGLVAFSGLKVRRMKYPDRTIELVVEGLGQSPLTTRQFIYSTEKHSETIMIRWNHGIVDFFLCGRVDRQEYLPGDS
jgi:hypothetical protein